MTGCVTTREPAGTFTTGGSGTYGNPAPGSELPPETTSFAELFGGAKKSDPTKSVNLHLAYARVEEANGNRAGARNATDEQRASYATARKYYQHALTLNEKSVDATIGVARMDEVAGRIGDAEQGFLKAVRLDGNSPRSLDALGQFYANQKRWNDALPTLQRAVAASPDDKDIRYHYGVALAKSGQTEQAMPQLVDALGSAKAHYNMGVILYEQRQLVASEEQFAAAVMENPRLEQAAQWLTEVRRELSEQSRVSQGAPKSGANAAMVRTAGHAASDGRQATGLPTTAPAGSRPLTPAANQPRRIQQTAGTMSADGDSYTSRPMAPVSPLPRQ